MRSRTSTWFETKVKYQKTMEDGSEKVVSEAVIGINMLADVKLEDFKKNEILKRAVSMTAINIGGLYSLN